MGAVSAVSGFQAYVATQNASASPRQEPKGAKSPSLENKLGPAVSISLSNTAHLASSSGKSGQ